LVASRQAKEALAKVPLRRSAMFIEPGVLNSRTPLECYVAQEKN